MEREYRKLNRRRGFWKGMVILLVGVVLGLLLSPSKDSIRIRERVLTCKNDSNEDASGEEKDACTEPEQA